MLKWKRETTTHPLGSKILINIPFNKYKTKNLDWTDFFFTKDLEATSTSGVKRAEHGLDFV